MGKGQKRGKSHQNNHQDKHSQQQQSSKDANSSLFGWGAVEGDDEFWVDEAAAAGDNDALPSRLYFYLFELLTWNQILQIIIFVSMVAAVVVSIGTALGVAVSVQSLQPENAFVLVLSSPSSNSRGSIPQPLFHHARTTIGDNHIANHNPLARGSNPMSIVSSLPHANNYLHTLLYPLVELSAPLIAEKRPPKVSVSTSTTATKTTTTATTTITSVPSSSPREAAVATDTEDDKAESPSLTLSPTSSPSWNSDPPLMSFHLFSQVQPEPCEVLGPNGDIVYGYKDTETLLRALQEVTAYRADQFMRWNKYFATVRARKQEESMDELEPDHFYHSLVFSDSRHYYEDDVVLTICPHTLIQARQGPLAFINTENLVLECYKCTVEVSQGSHFAFGPYAANIFLRGLSFKGATTTSLLFHHDGASVSVEDCYFFDNQGITKQLGSVADVNSTSVVNFYRCSMKNGPNDRVSGLTSLSIRAKDVEL